MRRSWTSRPTCSSVEFALEQVPVGSVEAHGTVAVVEAVDEIDTESAEVVAGNLAVAVAGAVDDIPVAEVVRRLAADLAIAEGVDDDGVVVRQEVQDRGSAGMDFVIVVLGARKVVLELPVGAGMRYRSPVDPAVDVGLED